MKQRIQRLNSLLKEVIAEVITREVRNPHIHRFLTVTAVDISSDLHSAKVHISVIGSDAEKNETLTALQIGCWIHRGPRLEKSDDALFSQSRL